MYPILSQELDTLKSGYTSPHLTLFGAFFGAAIALWITVETIPLPEVTSTRMYLALYVLAGATVLFLIFSIRDWIKAHRIIKRIEKETEPEVVTFEGTQKPMNQ